MNKPTLAIYGIKDRNISEVPAYVHDHNVCLMQNGKIIKYLQLERYSRRKYDNRLDLFIDDLIENYDFNLPDDFDIVCVNDFVGNAFISSKGKIHFEADRTENLSFTAHKAYAYYQKEVWFGHELNAFKVQHEVAHICSTLPFYGEFKENSLLVSIDGGSSLGNYSAFIYRNGKTELIENNWSDLGFASKLFNDNSLSFKILNEGPESHCSVPGKLMGFASFGKADEKIEKWLHENNYFKDYWNREDDILKSIEKNFNVRATFSTHDEFIQNIAATIQKIFEDAVINKLKKLQEKFNAENLYYGGGCALNIVTNTKIIESHLFKNVYIAPCCNDSGLSVGAACLVEHIKGNKIQISDAYLQNIACDLLEKYELNDTDIQTTADILINGGIVGICNSYGEAGPRALGNRSLIALANSKKLSEKLSREVKKREWYRPVAPIMLKEIAEEVSMENPEVLSKYMLMDFHIKDEYKSKLEGVVHANGTARIQTIEKEIDNPFMFRLLTLLYEKYGYLALINTSFNAAGEPIVHTTEDARKSASKMGLDGLVLNGKLLLRGDI